MWLRNMRGLKVIFEGKSIGRVIQGIPCPTVNALDGIWIDKSFMGMRFISAEHICVIGKHAITTDHPGERLRMKPSQLFIRAIGTDGMRLGAVTDANIHEQSLAITHLELTCGWFEGLFGEKKLITEYRYDLRTSRIIVSADEPEMEVEP